VLIVLDPCHKGALAEMPAPLLNIQTAAVSLWWPWSRPILLNPFRKPRALYAGAHRALRHNHHWRLSGCRGAALWSECLLHWDEQGTGPEPLISPI